MYKHHLSLGSISADGGITPQMTGHIEFLRTTAPLNHTGAMVEGVVGGFASSLVLGALVLVYFIFAVPVIRGGCRRYP